jgi:hypothetical protein
MDGFATGTRTTGAFCPWVHWNRRKFSPQLHVKRHLKWQIQYAKRKCRDVGKGSATKMILQRYLASVADEDTKTICERMIDWPSIQDNGLPCKRRFAEDSLGSAWYPPSERF